LLSKLQAWLGSGQLQAQLQAARTPFTLVAGLIALLVVVNAIGYEFMQQMHAPRLLSGILLFNAVNTVLILLVTLQWKISIHLFTFTSSVALLFLQFGAAAFWALPAVPLLMWSRMVLKAHNFMQTLVGALIGFGVMYVELRWWTGL
jgi:membrane-associated phospholipid phosphatase